MRLTSMELQRLGPFYERFKLEIDPHVTILTGSNDTGKTRLLEIIKLFLSGGILQEHHVNQDHVQEAPRKWNESPDVVVQGFFQLGAKADLESGAYKPDPTDVAKVVRNMNEAYTGQRCSSQTKNHGADISWRVRLPTVVECTDKEEIRDTINLRQPRTLESLFLDAAFGTKFNFEKYEVMNAVNFTRALRDASDRINKLVDQVIPSFSSLKFSFDLVAGTKSELALLLRDRHDGMTPFGFRGSGVKKMISLVAQLIVVGKGTQHTVVLIDEPENSLHADAQHLLRQFLFALTQETQFQVIYATHSPCMIDPFKSEQIRLLRREQRNGRATSVLENKPWKSNFQPLRTSLGINPADSLLYAPVTVIIEGDTEFKCLSQLVERAIAASLPGFEDARKLLSLAHFLDGMGDNFEYLCRLASSHGTKVVLFLDGDKRKVVAQQQVRERHPSIPIVFLPDRSEFEQLVPAEVYFKALAEELGRNEDGQVMRQAWQNWLANHVIAQRKAFTKQVTDWLEEQDPEICLSKPQVMSRAVNFAKPEEINAAPLRELLEAIRGQLKGTPY